MNGLPVFLKESRSPASSPVHGRGGGTAFVENGISYLSRVIRDGYAHWELSRRDGILQRLDPRVKILSMAFLLVVVSLKRQIVPELGITVFILALFAVSRFELFSVLKRILALSLVFGVLVPLPSALNLFSDDRVALTLIRLPRAYALGGFQLPAEIGLTQAGMAGILMLFLRVTNSVALSLLLLYSTPLPGIVKALRIFRVPDGMLVVVTLSYKYLFAFARTVEEMHQAKKSRLVRGVERGEARRWVAGRIAFLFRKVELRCEEIFKAMVSRGFGGEVRIAGLRRLSRTDWAAAAISLSAGIFFLIW